MKKLGNGFYQLEPGIYVERLENGWVISNEACEALTEPRSTLDAAVAEYRGTAAPSERQPVDADLVTLSEAAPLLGRTRQALAKARRAGTLQVDPVVTGRTVVLYDLAQLKARYEK